MTTEDDFQRALDANPDDWQTRLVFADWLDERRDPRGPGYRVLGRLRLYPYRVDTRNWWTAEGDSRPTHNHLPRDWFEKVARHKYTPANWRWPDRWDIDRDNRREIEDAAALAFTRLPAERRAELLVAEATATRPRARTQARKKPKRKK